MRVAVVVEQCLNRVPGGTGRYTRELTRALAATAADDDSVGTWTAWHRTIEAARIDGVGRAQPAAAAASRTRGRLGEASARPLTAVTSCMRPPCWCPRVAPHRWS